MTYGGHYVANNLLVGNAKADEFRGEPSVVTNHVTLASGSAWTGNDSNCASRKRWHWNASLRSSPRFVATSSASSGVGLPRWPVRSPRRHPREHHSLVARPVPAPPYSTDQ